MITNGYELLAELKTVLNQKAFEEQKRAFLVGTWGIVLAAIQNRTLLWERTHEGLKGSRSIFTTVSLADISGQAQDIKVYLWVEYDHGDDCYLQLGELGPRKEVSLRDDRHFPDRERDILAIFTTETFGRFYQGYPA